MADQGPEDFKSWRETAPSPAGPVFEASPSVETGARVTIWHGPPPDTPSPIHPLVAVPLSIGVVDDHPVWVEERPLGPLMSDLTEPIEIVEAAQLMAQVADGLGALHARGHAHGGLSPAMIVITLDCSPVLIGAGVYAGTPSDDLAAVVAMLRQICPSAPIPAHGSAAELAAGLRETAMSGAASKSNLREQVELAMAPPPATPQTLRIHLTPMGYTDEVQPDLGPDARSRGLLDQWSNTGSHEEFTDDRTETISASELAAQGRQIMLERLDELYGRPAIQQRFGEQDGTPCASVKALLAEAPLDSLPVADGVLRRRIPIQEQENTVEVTQEAPIASRMHATESTGETTGWTGGETTIPRTTQIRLLTVALMAALGVLTVLAVVSAYLTYVGL